MYRYTSPIMLQTRWRGADLELKWPTDPTTYLNCIDSKATDWIFSLFSSKFIKKQNVILLHNSFIYATINVLKLIFVLAPNNFEKLNTSFFLIECKENTLKFVLFRTGCYLQKKWFQKWGNLQQLHVKCKTHNRQEMISFYMKVSSKIYRIA